MEKFQYQDLTIDFQEQIGTSQQAIECSIDTVDCGGVRQLLSVTADTNIVLVERIGDDAKIMGGINYKIIALTNQETLTSYDYLCEYSSLVKAKDIDDYTMLWAKGCILDIDSAILGESIKLQSVVDITLIGNNSSKERVLTAVGEGVLANYVDIGFQSQAGKIDGNFLVVEEYESGVNIDKVLLFDSDIISCNAAVQANGVVVTGEIVVTVVYSSGGSINTKNFNIPFSEEVAAVADIYNRAEIHTTITNSKIVLSGMEDNNILRLEITCKAQGVIYSNQEMTIVDDVCMITNHIEVKDEVICYDKYLGEQCFKEKIAGSGELDDSKLSVRKILSACSSRNCVTNVSAHDGRLTVQGVLACSVIYEDANTAISSIQIELPYTITQSTDKVQSDDIVSVNTVAEILSTKLRRDREIEVTALITIHSQIKRPIKFKAIQEVTVGECKDQNNYAITIYQTIVGESTWNIAKELGASQQAVMEQNPTLSAEGGKGQKIVYYRQIISGENK